MAVNTKRGVLSIIIPTRNEEARLADTLDDYLNYFSSQHDGDFEIIVVLNGCIDNTLEIVTGYVRESERIRPHYFKEKIGKGRAIKEGFRIAQGDIVSFTDADGATSPQELDRMVKQLGDNDGVIGSRWLPESNILKSQGLARRIASRGFNILVRVMFGLPFRDTQCGAKVFKKKAIDDVKNELKASGFVFDVELIYRLRQRGYKIKELAVTWENKQLSSLNLLATIPTMLLALIWLRLSKWPTKLR